MEVKSHSLYSFDFDEKHSLLSFLWTEKTATMTDADYQAGLRDYGQTMIERRARRGLIDLRKFRHRPGEHLMSWRTNEIIPMYHKAGLEKFAYVLPEGVPAPPDDAPAKKEAGEQFLTKRFATDRAARAWLTAKS